MSKTKNYYWDMAEKESDTIIENYVNGSITKDVAIDKMSKVEGLELVGIDEYNIDEVLDEAKSDALNKSVAVANDIKCKNEADAINNMYCEKGI